MYTSATSKRGVFVAQVQSNASLCEDHYLLRLVAEGFPPTRPGQFVQLQCRGLHEQVSVRQIDRPEGAWPRLVQPELADKEPLLRRPLSIADCRQLPGGFSEIDLIYRAIGTGTKWLARVPAGAKVSLLGPLGNGFAIRPGKPLAALVGGGVGIPPMIYLAGALAAEGKQVVAFNGTKTAHMLPLEVDAAKVSAAAHPELCVDVFTRLDVPAVIATDDGSLGFGGAITEAFRIWLNTHLPAEGDLVVYSCGPEGMMRALADMCVSRGYECQLALERHMACGMGTCQSCVVKIRDTTERGWSFKLCCADGPVFDAKDVLW